MSTQQHLAQRLNDAHYIFNVLLSLPLPCLLLVHSALDVRTSIVLGSLPALFLLQAIGRKGLTNAETIVERVTLSARIFNLAGWFWMRNTGTLGIKLWHSVVYLVVWQILAFAFPQPPYLGPTKVTALTSEQFDETILIVPPAEPFKPTTEPTLIGDESVNDEPRIVELPSYADQQAMYNERRRKSPTYHIVLFHAEWMSKSRELEITLSRLSQEYTSPTLQFHITTPDMAPQTFYEQNLSSHATSTDLPVIRMFYRGRVIAQLPRGLEELKVDKRRKRNEQRRRARQEKVAARDESGSETGSDYESEDEREAETMVAMERYKWDRSKESICRSLKLEERSRG